MTEPAVTFAEMPLLPGFSHAILESVTVGPRRAVMLTLAPLVWVGAQGQRGLPVIVRLGGIVNLEEATAFFAKQRLPDEIAGLNYAGHVSKPGDLHLEIVFERVDARFVIQCGNVTVAEGAVSIKQAGV